MDENSFIDANQREARARQSKSRIVGQPRVEGTAEGMHTPLPMIGALVVIGFALVGSILVLRRLQRAEPDNVALAARVTAMRPFADAAVGDEVKVEGIPEPAR